MNIEHRNIEFNEKNSTSSCVSSGWDLSALQKGEEGFFTGLVEKSLLKEKILANFCPKN